MAYKIILVSGVQQWFTIFYRLYSIQSCDKMLVALLALYHISLWLMYFRHTSWFQLPTVLKKHLLHVQFRFYHIYWAPLGASMHHFRCVHAPSLIWVLGESKSRAEAPEREAGTRVPQMSCPRALSTPSQPEPLGPQRSWEQTDYFSCTGQMSHLLLTPMGFSHEGDDSSLMPTPPFWWISLSTCPKQALC